MVNVNVSYSQSTYVVKHGARVVITYRSLYDGHMMSSMLGTKMHEGRWCLSLQKKKRSELVL